MNHRVTLFTFAFVIASCHLQVLIGQEATDESRTIEHWLGVATDVAKRQRIVAHEEPSKRFQLLEKAVFRHTQPIRGDDIGAVYVWVTQSKRPAAIGVFFAWSQGRSRAVMEEFHSLHEKPIRKYIDDRETWNCPSPGLEWRLAKGFQKPIGDKRRMKLQARQFTRELKMETESFDCQRWDLRLAPKPFYEYSDADAGIEYGAIFGFCQGTDTELLVIIEARKDREERNWHYALAPFSDYKIKVKMPDKTTWTSPDGTYGENGKPHYWNFVEKKAKPDFEK